MTIAAIALVSALMGAPIQNEAALQAGPTRAPGSGHETDVRVVVMNGPGDSRGLDADSDGVVTREEFSAPMATAFERLDADHDGRLTTEELAAERGPDGPGRHFVMRGGPMTAHGEGGNEEVFMFRRGGGPEGGPPPGLGGPGERRVEIRRFGGPGGRGSMDTDNDGKVSEAEFLAPMREAFQSMDADHDGSLDDSEEPHGPPPPRPAPPAPAN